LRLGVKQDAPVQGVKGTPVLSITNSLGFLLLNLLQLTPPGLLLFFLTIRLLHLLQRLKVATSHLDTLLAQLTLHATQPQKAVKSLIHVTLGFANQLLLLFTTLHDEFFSHLLLLLEPTKLLGNTVY
jgi:hypothetical protein